MNLIHVTNQPAHRVAHGGLVIDEQQTSTDARGRRIHNLRLLRAIRPARGLRGQDDAEGAAPAGRAGDLDASTHGLHQRQADGQAQPRALSHGTGGEERVEDAALDVRRHAVSVVGDLQLDVPTAAGAQGHPHPVLLGRSVRQRLERVQQQVHDNLGEAPFVAMNGQHRLQRARQPSDQPNLVAEQPQRAVHHVHHVHRTMQLFIRAGEGAQVADNRADATSALLRFGHHLTQLHELFVGQLRLGEQLAQVREIGADVGQGVVDFVRDARGERANRRHPIRQHPLRLQPRAVRGFEEARRGRGIPIRQRRQAPAQAREPYAPVCPGRGQTLIRTGCGQGVGFHRRAAREDDQVRAGYPAQGIQPLTARAQFRQRAAVVPQDNESLGDGPGQGTRQGHTQDLAVPPRVGLENPSLDLLRHLGR